MPSATDAITQAKTYSNINKAATDTLTGSASSKLSQSDFLKLLTEQLQYQDPMEPMDNSQFVSQINQFAQLDSLTSLKTSMSSMEANMAANNSTMQTLSLVGKKVTLVDPADKEGKNTITGTVTEAKFGPTGSTIIVNDKEYPLANVISVGEHNTTPTTDPSKPAA